MQQTLLVDNNAINGKLLLAFIKRHRTPFKQAKDGQEVLYKYKEASGAIDVVLMDISMHVMDGTTSTRLTREFEKENALEPAHVIALTGSTSASARLEAWTGSVDDFLTKPVDFN